MENLLVIEDDADLREGLCFALEMEGYAVCTCSTMHEGLAQVRAGVWSLVLLDCNLPDGNGYDFLAALRDISETPVLMLTARNTEMDEVKALELGVADFMSKPFSLAVLKARIRRILAASRPQARLASGGIVIDRARGRVMRGETPVALSKVEYQLLCYLMENREQVLTKEQILAHVWDAQGKFVDENTLSVTIRRLRAKIEQDPKHPEHIRTVHGVGYAWRGNREGEA